MRSLASRAACRFFLCDDQSVTIQSYNLQLSGSKKSLQAGLLLSYDLLGRDPAFAQRWVDLGGALSLTRSLAPAAICFQRALLLGKNSGTILTGGR